MEKGTLFFQEENMFVYIWEDPFGRKTYYRFYKRGNRYLNKKPISKKVAEELYQLIKSKNG